MSDEYSDQIDMKAFKRVGLELSRASAPIWIAGEKAIVRMGSSKTTYWYVMHTVKSVGSKTGHVTLSNGERYFPDGPQIGAIHTPYKVLLKCTHDLEALAIRQARVSYIENIKWATVPDEVIEDIIRTLRRARLFGVPE